MLENNIFSIDELKLKTKKDLRVLINILIEMEMAGIVYQEFGIGYKLKK